MSYDNRLILVPLNTGSLGLLLLNLERRNLMIIAIAVTSVAGLFTLTDTETFTIQSLDLEQPFQTAEAAKGVNHLIEMEAVAMPQHI